MTTRTMHWYQLHSFRGGKHHAYCGTFMRSGRIDITYDESNVTCSKCRSRMGLPVKTQDRLLRETRGEKADATNISKPCPWCSDGDDVRCAGKVARVYLAEDAATLLACSVNSYEDGTVLTASVAPDERHTVPFVLELPVEDGGE